MEKLNIAEGISAVYGKFKNAGMVPHFHESYSIGLFTDGEYRYRSGTKEAVVKAGEVRVVAPYELHETYEGEWSYLHFDINPTLLIESVRDIEQNQQPSLLDILPLNKERLLLESGLALYSALRSREVLEIEQSFTNFTATLLASSSSLNLISNLTMDSAKLGQALEYIFTFWNKADLSIEEIAREVAFSPYYFTRSFHKEFLITPHKFIQSLRVDRARQMIVKTNEPLAHIAIECGFSDQSHMIRVFKRISGYTPNRLRI